MQIKRFEAPNMTEALRQIKTEFGPEAVILSARSVRSETGILGQLKKPTVEVTAATDLPAPESRREKPAARYKSAVMMDKRQNTVTASGSAAGKFKRSLLGIKNFKAKTKTETTGSPQTGEADDIKQLRTELLSSGLDANYVKSILKDLAAARLSLKPSSHRSLGTDLGVILKKMGVAFQPIGPNCGKQRIVAFVGPAGSGKTTTIAKIAAIHAIQMGERVGFLSFDTYRIGASSLLKFYAKIIGIPIEIASNIGDVNKAIKKLRNKDLILIDTPGMSRGDEERMESIKRCFNRIKLDELHLLLDCTTQEKVQEDTIKYFDVLPVNRMIFTRLDKLQPYGSILNLAIFAKLPISYFTDGQDDPEDIKAPTLDNVLAKLISEKFRTNDPAAVDKSGTKETGNIDMDGRFAPEGMHPTSTPGRNSGKVFLANRSSDVFHCVDCKSVKRIKTDNLIMFESAIEAINKNYQPCRVCHPDKTGIFPHYETISKNSKIANYQ